MMNDTNVTAVRGFCKFLISSAAPLVEIFEETFNPPRDPAFWLGLIREENKEAMELVNQIIQLSKEELETDFGIDLQTDFLKEIVDLGYVQAGLLNLVAQIEDELDPRYKVAVIEEAAQAMVLPALVSTVLFEPEDLMMGLLLVHQSNMSKLGPNGEVFRDPNTGKVLKGPYYQAPDLRMIVQMSDARLKRAA